MFLQQKNIPKGNLVLSTFRGLNADYESLFTAMKTMSDGLPFCYQLFDLLLSQERVVEKLHKKSQNIEEIFQRKNQVQSGPQQTQQVNRNNSFNHGQGRGRSPFNHGGFISNQVRSYSSTRCQICGRPRHSTLACFKMEDNYQTEDLPQSFAGNEGQSGSKLVYRYWSRQSSHFQQYKSD